MREIKVNLDKRTYTIYIGNNILKSIFRPLRPHFAQRPLLIVTNKNISARIGKKLLQPLKAVNKDVTCMEVPDSERAKSFKVYSQIVSALSRLGKGIKPAIIAFGGGVVGDVAGFAAATYRRGIPFIQVPTTLLAQVDSSIGGKVAIDLPQAKNLVGSFYQPAAVISDLSLLNTLPKKQIKNGLAEIIKYGVIYDASFFKYLETNVGKILKLSAHELESSVFKSAYIKARVVEADELDNSGIRVILNFGHTFAHAIETAFRYSLSYTHGEAVAIGMALASSLAVKMKMFSMSDSERITNLILNAGLPIRFKKSEIDKVSEAIRFDKKFTSGKNRFVLPRRIGQVRTVEGVPWKLIESVLNESSF